MLNKKVILKILCAVMALVGLSMLLPCAVSLIYKEYSDALCFLEIAAPVIILGLIGLKILPKQDNSIIRMRDGFFIVAATWVLMSLIGALPFVFTGAIPNFFDAFFETVSGFTTTGATALSEIESLPRGMLFWRSFTHWLGGMGVLVLTIALLPMLGIGGQKIMRAETTGPTMDKISNTINGGAKGLYIIYTALTIIEIIILGACGMDLFDASTHAMGTLGTGGFSTYNNSIAHFNSAPIEIIIALFMLIAGVNFNLYYGLISGKGIGVFKDSEFKAYMGIVASSTILMTIALTFNKTYSGVWESLRKAFFQVTSIISSTGYATSNYEEWPSICRLLVIFLMFVGGCAGSTAGGLKVVRILLVGKLIKRNVKQRLNPRAITSVKLDGKEVSEETLNGVAAHIGLYVFILGVGTFIMSLAGIDNITSFSSVLTCLSNIGPGFNLVSPVCNFGFLPNWIKFMLSILMIAGRLELFTIAILFTKDYWKK